MENVINLNAWKARRSSRISAVLDFRKGQHDLNEYCRIHNLNCDEFREAVNEISQELSKILRGEATPGSRLKSIRELFLIESDEFSSQLGLTISQLEEIEADRQPMTIGLGVQMAIELSVDPLTLLYPGREVAPEDRYRVERLYFRMRDPAAFQKRVLIKIGGALIVALFLSALFFALK